MHSDIRSIWTCKKGNPLFEAIVYVKVVKGRLLANETFIHCIRNMLDWMSTASSALAIRPMLTLCFLHLGVSSHA